MKVICNQTRIQTNYLIWLVFINIIGLTSGWLHQGWLGFGIAIMINMVINLFILKSYRKKLQKNRDYISINMGAFRHTKPKSYYEVPLVDIEHFFIKPHPKKKHYLRTIQVVFNRNQTYDFIIDRSQLLKLETMVRRPLNHSLMQKRTAYILPKQRRFIWFQLLGSLIGVGLTAMGILLYKQQADVMVNFGMIVLVVLYALGHFYTFLDPADPWYVKLYQSLIGMVIYVAIVFSVMTIFSTTLLETPFSMVYLLYAVYALSSFVVVVLIFMATLYALAHA
jgi:hypothetical protein